jgi:hypothetical protein
MRQLERTRRILLDEGVPVGVRPHLQGFSVDTAAEVGWSGLVNGAQPGGLVLDPFCGPGSNLAAAQQISRDYLGIELDAGRRAAATWTLRQSATVPQTEDAL